MATLPELLKTLVEKGGSDLHITTNTPPQIRVHGHLQRLEGTDLTPADTKQLAYSVLTDGFARPVSTCEMRLGETPIRRAIARRLRPRAVRACRSRSPIVASPGSGEPSRLPRTTDASSPKLSTIIVPIDGSPDSARRRPIGCRPGCADVAVV